MALSPDALMDVVTLETSFKGLSAERKKKRKEEQEEQLISLLTGSEIQIQIQIQRERERKTQMRGEKRGRENKRNNSFLS